VQKSRFLTVVFLVGVLLVGASVLTGCSEAKSRRAGKEILQKVDTAQRLYEKALALLANPVYKAGGQFAPIIETTEISPGQIEFPPAGTLHPQAWKDLQQAEKILSGAMEAGAEALPADRAVGHRAMGRVVALKGYYLAAEASSARSRANKTLDQAEELIMLIRAQNDLVEYYDRLIAMSDEDVLEMRSSASAAAADLEARIGSTDAQLAELRKACETIIASNEELNAQARNLRVDSRLATGTKGLELLEKALEIERRVNRAASEVAGMEYTIGVLGAGRGVLALELAAVQGQLAAAEEILATRKSNKETNSKKRSELLVSIAAGLEKVETLLHDIAEASERARLAEDRAAGTYVQAVGQLKEARKLQDTSQSNPTAEEADAHMALAGLYASRLKLQEHGALLVGGLTKLWANLTPPREAPPAVGKVQAYISAPAATRKSAEQHYTAATELYARALSAVERQQRWIYQGQLAAAYVGLYQLSRDPDVLDRAKEILREALKDKQASPYLAPVDRLQRLVEPQPDRQ